MRRGSGQPLRCFWGKGVRPDGGWPLGEQILEGVKCLALGSFALESSLSSSAGRHATRAVTVAAPMQVGLDGEERSSCR